MESRRRRVALEKAIEIIIIIAVFAMICAGLIAVKHFASKTSKDIDVKQEDMVMSKAEAQKHQIAVRSVTKNVDATRLLGRTVQYSVTIYNNTDHEIKDWSISTSLTNEGQVQNVINANYEETTEKLVITPEKNNKTIHKNDTLTFGITLSNKKNQALPAFGSMVIDAKQSVNPSEMMAYWALIIALFAWAIITASFTASTISHRKLLVQKEMDERVLFQTIYTFTSFIDAKDPYTRGHSLRVAFYARELAKEMGLPENDVKNIYYSGLMHDAGKISVPDAVLNKPGKLNDDEFQLIKSHTTNGARMLRNYTAIDGLKEVALYHHEKYNGKGYPTGISGKSIPLYARVVCVADSYDAMSSNRVYRNRLTQEEIIAELDRCSGSQFDPEIVPYMIDMIKTGKADKLRDEADNVAL
ncbi:MAG: HD domain-containing phosphohydrolase [Candidatus Weimeria sp.]